MQDQHACSNNKIGVGKVECCPMKAVIEEVEVQEIEEILNRRGPAAVEVGVRRGDDEVAEAVAVEVPRAAYRKAETVAGMLADHAEAGVAQIQLLKHKDAMDSLAKFIKEYPEAPERMRVAAAVVNPFGIPDFDRISRVHQCRRMLPAVFAGMRQT